MSPFWHCHSFGVVTLLALSLFWHGLGFSVVTALVLSLFWFCHWLWYQSPVDDTFCTISIMQSLPFLHLPLHLVSGCARATEGRTEPGPSVQAARCFHWAEKQHTGWAAWARIASCCFGTLSSRMSLLPLQPFQGTELVLEPGFITVLSLQQLLE